MRANSHVASQHQRRWGASSGRLAMEWSWSTWMVTALCVTGIGNCSPDMGPRPLRSFTMTWSRT